jgi:hypothetical protein
MAEEEKNPKKPEETEDDLRDLAPEKDVKGGRASGGGGGAQINPPLNQE